MILVTRLNETQFYVNPHKIEFIESTPDTVISLVTGKKVIVKDSVEDIIQRIIKYRKNINLLNVSVKNKQKSEE